MMYAIIQSGGKQYRVTEGQRLKLEKLEVKTGKAIDFSEVLMVANEGDVQVGAPYVDAAVVTAEVVAQGRLAKIEVLKFKRRKQHMKQMGHRQAYTEVKITGILLGDKKLVGSAPIKKKAPAKKAQAKKAKPAKKAVAKKKVAAKKPAKKKTKK